MTQSRDQLHRYESDFNDEALLTAVENVAFTAAPDAPARCSQRQFDRARARAGYPDLPTAATVARRLRSGWPQLLAVIFDTSRSATHYVALRGRDTRYRELTLDQAAAAVRFVADTLQSASITAAQIDQVMGPLRQRALARRPPTPDAHALYPSSNQIDSAVGLADAIAAAGLTRPGGGSPGGVPLADVMERFLRIHGYLPPAKPAAQWARAAGISVESGTYADAFRELSRRRAAHGLWTPPKPPPRPQRAIIDTIVAGLDLDPDGVGTRCEPAVTKHWTDEEIRAGLLLAAERAHRERRRLTQPLLRAYAKANRGVIPSWSVVDRAAKRHGENAGDWVKQAAREYSAKRRIRPPADR